MEARLRKDGEVTIIHIFGHLSYEEVDRFSEVCNQLLDEKVVFNFDGLSFVGSSGITSFFAAIQNLAKRSSVRPKLCCLALEFKKYIDNFATHDFDYYETEFIALKSYRVKEGVKEDVIGNAYTAKAVGTEEPIGRAYPLGTTIDARPESAKFKQFTNLDIAKSED